MYSDQTQTRQEHVSKLRCEIKCYEIISLLADLDNKSLIFLVKPMSMSWLEKSEDTILFLFEHNFATAHLQIDPIDEKSNVLQNRWLPSRWKCHGGQQSHQNLNYKKSLHCYGVGRKYFECWNIFRKRGECVLLPQKVIVIIIRSGKQMIGLLLCHILIIWDMPSVNLKVVNQWLSRIQFVELTI